MSTMSTVPPRRTGADSDLITGPVLFRVLTTSNLAAAGARHRIGAISSVTFKRGERATATRGNGELVLTVPDKSMSGTHARLVRLETGWRLEDLDSTHGTWLNGQRRKASDVTDRATFVLGTTTFQFVSVLPDAPERPDDLVIRGDETLPAITTLSCALGLRFRELGAFASTALPVLISGPTGSGKEWIAHAVHTLSGRRGHFVPVNCAALPENLAESELFGYKKGAFSGAAGDRVGLVEASNGGTLFLDEIAELSPTTQARLLRVLQEGEVRPVGATAPMAVDLRVVAASHVDLEGAVLEGRFREDLLARVAGARLVLPGLADRTEDLGVLLASITARLGRPLLELTPDAGQRLLDHRWPRNLRELDQVIGRAAALSSDGLIRSASLTLDGATSKLSAEDETLRNKIVALLAEHSGNVSAVARVMGKGRRQIQRWIKRFDIRSG